MKSLDRREFLKMGAAVSASVAAVATGSLVWSGDHNLETDYRTRESHGDEYRKNMPKAFYRTIENRPGYVGTTKVVGPIEQWDAREHGFAQFTRRVPQKDYSGEWGQVVKEVLREKGEIIKNLKGQKYEDFRWGFAMVKATDMWHVNLGPGRVEYVPIAKQKLEMPPGEASLKIKKVAKWYGIDQIGICEITEDMRPFFYRIGRTQGTMMPGPPGYTDEGREIPWPYPHKYCIAMGNFEDLQGTKAMIGPLNNISVATECSDGDIYPHYIASVIRGLGYDAKAHYIAGTDDFIEAPFAIKAGIGEMGRNGQVVTPWGSHIRLFCVTTDMPLAVDKPIDFGLQDFCKVCKKCAENCPGGAISHDDERSEFNGTLRYPFNPQKCCRYRFVYGCASCVAACPFSKPDNLVHSIGRTIGQNKFGARLLVTMDDLFYGRKPKPRSLQSFAPWRI